MKDADERQAQTAEDQILMAKPKTKKRGHVTKVIMPLHPSEPEKAEIEVEGADDLYKEIRIENVLEDEKGRPVKLKEKDKVDVTIEADPSATHPQKRRAEG
jgi:hypothetical protein